MNRRSFLSGLVAVPIAGLLAKFAPKPVRTPSDSAEIQAYCDERMTEAVRVLREEIMRVPPGLEGISYHQTTAGMGEWKGLERHPYPGRLSTPSLTPDAARRMGKKMIEVLSEFPPTVNFTVWPETYERWDAEQA